MPSLRLVPPIEPSRVRARHPERGEYAGRGQEHPFVLFVLLIAFGLVWLAFFRAGADDDRLTEAAECADVAVPGQSGTAEWRAAFDACLAASAEIRP
jgi:hypothetical protein